MKTRETKKRPSLRFKEFSDEWEESNFKRASIINPKNDKLPQSFIYIDLDSVEKGVLRKENVILQENAPSRAQRILKNKDILFQSVRPYQMNNLLFNKSGNYVASTGYIVLRTQKSSVFLYQLLHTFNVFKSIIRRSTGSNYPAISPSDFSPIKFKIPSLPEQEKIAAFLSAVDKKHAQLERKKELLKSYKKGAMQKLFSKEWRFADSAGKPYPDWQEKRLGEIATISTGSSNRIDSSLDQKYTFFDRSEDIRTSSIYLFEGEAIIVAGEGRVFVPKYFIGKFDLHQRTYAIMNFKDSLSKYLFFFISYNKHYLSSQAVGSTVKSLRLPMFKKMPISLPSLPEQEKIANFLTSIDTKIEQLSQQLSKNAAFKKGLLQQLFI